MPAMHKTKREMQGATDRDGKTDRETDEARIAAVHTHEYKRRRWVSVNQSQASETFPPPFIGRERGKDGERERVCVCEEREREKR